jgi:ABC-2 type transport system permease protein
MYHLKLIWYFFRASAQQEMAYRSNFFIRVMYSLLGLVSGLAGLWALYGQVDTIHGWDMPSALALLGVYMLLGALRDLFIGPSLESLAGMDGELWTGRFDFTMLKPVNKQFLVSVRQWRVYALLDMVLALGVLGTAIRLMGKSLSWVDATAFLISLVAGVVVFYAVMLFFSSLVLWNNAFLFTWLFNGFFQLARYPVGIYPGWLRLMLTWVIPIALMTSIPAQALRGDAPAWMIFGASAAAVFLLVISSLVFRRGLRRYASASS